MGTVSQITCSKWSVPIVLVVLVSDQILNTLLTTNLSLALHEANTQYLAKTPMYCEVETAYYILTTP